MLIALSNSSKFILVDDVDSDLNKYIWSNNADKCAQGWIDNKHVYMHIVIALRIGLNVKKYQVDHKNRNGFDNRRDNLREATVGQNNMNCGPRHNSSTGYKGVTYRKRDRYYYVQIGCGTMKRHLGVFHNAEDAARVYDKAAFEAFGDFAWLNFPEEYGKTNGQS